MASGENHDMPRNAWRWDGVCVSINQAGMMALYTGKLNMHAVPLFTQQSKERTKDKGEEKKNRRFYGTIFSGPANNL